MTRGYITIATGKECYYELAANLLMSYRLNTKTPMPFAIIAEEENEYTAMFDDVIITKEATHSFMDKFLLLKLCPYDETIFFDADILAYGDLNEYWSVFTKNSTDFSSIGINVGLDDDGAWYNVEDIWKYGKLISYKTRVHMGVCFVRNSCKLKKLYDDCIEIYSNYDKLDFHEMTSSKDECIMGVAMPMNDMKAEDEITRMIVTYPCAKSISASMLQNKLSYTTNWGKSVHEDGLLIHFGTIQTKQPLYMYEAACVKYMTKCKGRKPTFFEKMKFEWGVQKSICKAKYFFQRVYMRIRRIAKR